ncbi:hypothetical protein [uncultured Methanobrevibacter sp.]|uniref:hypothetical protein n=1 Tax=uncultured Methanobrevibacter sp. TaxID=253161 RepID=UPI0025D45708|nr:hypothetical protein [uncultured Methanobrevibacter sp.]
MKYQIIKLYTEKLSIISFQHLIEDEKVKTMVNFNSSILPSDSEDIYLFRMDYVLRAVNNPISLNWIGIAVVKIIDRNDDESIQSLNEKLLFNNNEIKDFIQESIKNFSYFIGGELPKFNIKENHDN